MRSSTVVGRGKEIADGWLIEELKRREAAARSEADRLRARIEELTAKLARAEEHPENNQDIRPSNLRTQDCDPAVRWAAFLAEGDALVDGRGARAAAENEG
jgi:hypothetical protein